MKWNWGKGIVLAFLLFMGFVMSFVVRVQSDSKFDNELVVDEYYKADSRYSEEMAKLQNAVDLTEKPTIGQNEEGLLVRFPQSVDATKIKGTISCYRPSAGTLDFEIPIVLSGNTMLIPKKRLVGGRWEISLAWELDGKPYLIKKQMYL